MTSVKMRTLSLIPHSNNRYKRKAHIEYIHITNAAHQNNFLDRDLATVSLLISSPDIKIFSN